MASGVLGHEVDVQVLKCWLEQGQARLVDVREPDEYRRAHVAEAELRPLASLDPAALRPAAGRRLVLMCASGLRSGRAAEAARARGMEVYDLRGGLAAWKAAGLPVTGEAGAPLPIMRQVQIVAGGLVLLGFVLGSLIAPAWHLLSGLVGAGLVFAGVSGRCGMALLLARLPYNRVAATSPDRGAGSVSPA